MQPRSINIINIASDIGSVYAGKSRAPAAFKTAGLHEKLSSAGWHVTESSPSQKDGSAGWTSSTREPNGARNEDATVTAWHQVRMAVSSALSRQATDSEDSFPLQLVLAGECLYCPAIFSAYWDRIEQLGKRIGIIYMDADCDLYTPVEPNSSGNIAGMTLTHLTLREGALDSMKDFQRPRGVRAVDNNNIVLFGLNVDSPANKREHLGYLLDNSFRVATSTSVQKDPVRQAEAALEWLGEQVDYIFVHLDVDVIDPGLFPLGNVPNWTGISFEASMAPIRTFLSGEKVIGLSIAEVNPDHDPNLTMTKQLIEEIVAGLEGVQHT